MSLNWQWNDKMGSVSCPNGDHYDLYKGNATCIAVHTDEQGYYNLVWFWADRDHMKNMLGLNKGYENCMKSWLSGCVIKLNLAYKDVPTIVQALAKSKCEVTIDLYTE